MAAHEFFHAWNVKRLRDRALGPFDYARGNYTRLLGGSTRASPIPRDVIILRAGLDGREPLPGVDLADDWAKFAGRPGRNETPLYELSFEAWIKLYKPADNHANRAVSYYEKGMWAGMALDLMLRERTGGPAGLPELFSACGHLGAPRRG